MRYLALDVLFVSADESRKRNVAVINRKLESFANQSFNERHHRRLTQVVSPGLKAESEHAHSFLAALRHHLYSAFDLQSIARQNRGQDRNFHVELFRLVVN